MKIGQHQIEGRLIMAGLCIVLTFAMLARASFVEHMNNEEPVLEHYRVVATSGVRGTEWGLQSAFYVMPWGLKWYGPYNTFTNYDEAVEFKNQQFQYEHHLWQVKHARWSP